MSPNPGEVLLHYEIERKLGEGGMGEVWLARDTRLQRPVALKFLARKAILEAEARERLAREARAASALNHPNILAIYAVESVPGTYFIAMEYADGEPLDEWVASRSPSFDQLLDLALQIGDALGAAHRKGIELTGFGVGEAADHAAPVRPRYSAMVRARRASGWMLRSPQS